MKYYRTKFTIEVVSEEPLGETLSLADIDYAIGEGPCVGGNLTMDEKEITAKEAAAALIEFGSEPGFFSLDDDGNKLDD